MLQGLLVDLQNRLKRHKVKKEYGYLNKDDKHSMQDTACYHHNNNQYMIDNAISLFNQVVRLVRLSLRIIRIKHMGLSSDVNRTFTSIKLKAYHGRNRR